MAAAALSACAGTKKKPQLAYVERPVDQLYATGARRLDEHRWTEAVDYFEEVERQHPYSEWSRRAILMTAYAYYSGNQYEDAVAAADRFIQLYPGSPSAAYAYYLKAICYFEQIADVQRDQGATQNALAALRDVARRYPTTDYARDARVKVDMVYDQLAGKEMAVGRWYLRQNQPLAAIGRFKKVVDDYQTTSHTPEALYRLVEAYLTIGVVEEAKRNAAVLGFNYPGDRWYQDAYKLMERRGQPMERRPTPASNVVNPGPDTPTESAPLSSASPALPPPENTDALPPAEGAAPASSASPDAGPPVVDAPGDAASAPAKPKRWWQKLNPWDRSGR
ncbi:MAG: outer membrane protein assembly factor BamD [Caulobacteraceae bacterium]|nr:outer membrane protein assembly factor BamD [Caulobacteraceae bacterium]